MHTVLAIALLLIAQVQADSFGAPRKLPKRQSGFSNTTIIYTNTTRSATSTTVSPTITSLVLSTSESTTSSTSLSVSNSTSITEPSISDTDITDVPTLIPGPTQGIIDSNLTVLTVLTVFPTVNTTVTSEGCAGSVTYYNSIPPTVYLTVTESYEVTVTASNLSITETETLITPPPACEMTILALEAETGVEASVTIASTVSKGGNLPQATHNPVPPALAPTSTGVAVEAPQVEATVVLTTLYPNVLYTSTVIVTKKTPVQVVVPPTSQPPIFQNPPTPTDDAPEDKETLPVNPNQNIGGPRVSPTSSARVTNNGNSNAVLNPAPTPTPTPTPNTGGGLVVVPPATPGIGSIIDSIVNSPFVPAGPSRITNTPALTTTINNVGVGIFTSSIVIGSTAIPIPTSNEQTVVQVNGGTFTVRASEIIAPGTTVVIPVPVPANPTPTLVTAAPGVVISVGSTAAIVGGSTFQIGNNANPTTVVVAGQTISLGPSGVGLASTTIAPAGSPQAGNVVAPSTIITAAPGLVITVGSTAAVVGGSTIQIGNNANPTTVVVAGQTVSFGPSGVGLASTTIAPVGFPQANVVVVPPTIITAAPGLVITVGASSAVIGGTTFRIGDGASSTSIVVAGQTISVGPSGVGLVSTTVAPAAPSQTVVTAAPGVVITVGASTAVIAGTTFRIGDGAGSTSIVVAGQTISIGPSGVGLASTTIAPATGGGSRYVVETVGGLVLSVGPSQVVIDSTTYRIGSGAPAITTVIDGQTVSIGPSGVIFKTTTVRPTTAMAKTGSRSTQSGASATATASGTEQSENLGVRATGVISISVTMGCLFGVGLIMLAL